MRLHGRGRAVPVTDPEYAELSRFFADASDTHGVRSHERRGEAGLAEYRRVTNGFSVDGQPVFAE